MERLLSRDDVKQMMLTRYGDHQHIIERLRRFMCGCKRGR